MNVGEKLYLVTRNDLRHGSQAAQLVHGMATFAREHRHAFETWERASNTIVCLAVEDESALASLADEARAMNAAPLSTFREPDFDDALTCVTLAPCVAFEELCRGLRLACR